LKTLPVGKLTGGWTESSGGCFWFMNGNASVVINGGMIYGNKSNNSGGAVFAGYSGGTITMNGGIIIANDATSRGGAIYASEGTNVILNGGVIVGNNSFGDGGAIYAEKANLQINDIIIANNYCHSNGAAINMAGGEINIYNGLITNNTARSHSGGIYICNYDSSGANIQGTLTMYDGEISNNHSNYACGFIMYYGAKGYLKGGKIINNTTTDNSAGVAAYWGSEFVMDGGIIADNVVEYHANENNGGGGVLIGHGSSMTMNGGEIVNNKVLSPWDKQVNGGGLLICNTGTNNVTLNKGVISGNYCEGNGGGVSDTSDSAVIKIGSGMQIYDNIAHGVPSDVRLEQGQTINITENMSNNNSASHIGIKLADDYGSGTFTTGYGANNSGNNPSAYFFSNDGIKIATLNGNEVSFENTIESNVYDFVYIENGKRQNYKENNLTHAVNDYAKSRVVN
ncbi:MAG: hypothetical protein K2L47_02395, partial [Clostridia bacterium]|nr:hypothetical protein [Clostridia bacterium]